ncbi:MAG: hypothetical protein JXB39_10390 [Deltaproteobacteria bacterium]|nr:hypothetical protein [Deltaproteobacteria bacterium]
MRPLSWCLLLVAGCMDPEDSERASLDLRFPAGNVIDPKGPSASLRLAVTLEEAPNACSLVWSVEDPAGHRVAWEEEARLEDGGTDAALWDGRFDDGLPADPGPVWITATATCPDGSTLEAGEEGWVVRLGLSEVDLQAHPQDGGAVTLAFHKLSLWEEGITVLEDLPEYRSHPEGALADLDDDSGTARPQVEPWTHPDMPPWGDGDPGDGAFNLPAAFVAGVRVRVAVTAGATALSVRTGVPVPALGPDTESARAPDLRLTADILAPIDGEGRTAPGSVTTFESVGLPSTLGRTELTLSWAFQSWWAGAWHDVPGGSRSTTHRVYLLLDEPVLLDGRDRDAAPPDPWVGALEDTVEDVQGLEADTGALLDALRDFLHLDPYLVYNPGDRAYSGYVGAYVYWDWIWADLTAWLDRRDGIEMYCHSVSCLLSVLANTWGADTEQEVLGVGFTTNYVRAAGSEDWQRWGFTSHSVASPDGGATIWDASVDMDGDGAPGSAPHDPLAPKGLPQAEYLSLLTPDPIGIVNSGPCYVF